MKKILSIVLLLTLCLGLFAGCDKAPAEATGNLANAKAIVFNTYKPANKDEVPAKSADFELIASVLVDGVSHPVTWALEVTAGGADAVKLVDGSAAGVKKVDLTEKPAAEVRFTLTATISDKDGNTETVSFNFMTPVSNEPSADTQLSIKDALTLGASKEHNTYTEGKYYVSGEITEIYNTQYGNMKIKDAEGNILTIYGTFSADGKDRFDAMANQPKVGDTVKIYGIVGQYNGTPQIKNGWIVEITAGDNAGSTTPSEPSNDPAADSELSVQDAIALGASKEHDTYTSNKYYVIGEITEIYNEQYGNMKIKDAEGNILTIYGTYSADGATRFDKLDKKPAVGDTVKLYGIIGQYKDTPQMKNGWIIEITAGEGGNNDAGNDNTGSDDKDETPAAAGTMHVDANGKKWYVTIFDGKNNPALEATNTASEAGKVSVTFSKDGKTAKIKVGDHYIAPKGGNTNGLKEGKYDWAVVKNADGSYKFMGQGEDTVTLCLNVYQDYNKFRAYKNSNLEAHPESYFFNFIVK